MNERPYTGAIADDRKSSPPNHFHNVAARGDRRAWSIERAVAQNDCMHVADRQYSLLELTNRVQSPLHRRRRCRIERIGFSFDRTAMAGIRPPREALNNHVARASLPGGGDEILGSPRS